ncbi:C-C motif chemokine 4 homolog [Sylvia atricapilla]|uniref:C-C motif chemokine 4 homolog n=1 Tax=Sylvia atricapilla TaxID=48155 RepID=UPI003397B093
MRVPAATLAVLLVAICSLAQADLRVSRSATLSKKEICCFSTISRPILRSMIVSAYRINNSCPVEAVVFVTRNGREVCADPKARWVQKYLEHFELLEF